MYPWNQTANSGSRFLLANQQMGLIVEAGSLAELRRGLCLLPESIAEVYDRTLDRIRALPEKKMRLAIDALCWVVFSYRRLTVAELRHALATTPGQDKFDREDLNHVDDIRDSCLGLLIITHDTHEVALMHYSAQTHFQETLESESNIHAKIALICITHLSFSELEKSKFVVSAIEGADETGMYAPDAHVNEQTSDLLEPTICSRWLMLKTLQDW